MPPKKSAVKTSPKTKYLQALDDYEKFFVKEKSADLVEKSLKALTIAQLKELAVEEFVSLKGLKLKGDIIKAFIYGSLPPVPKKVKPGPKPKPKVTASTRARELEKKTVKELREIAKASGIKLTGVTKKEDIIKLMLVKSAAKVPKKK